MRKWILVALLTVLFLVSSSSATIHLPPSKRKSPQDLTYLLGSTGNTLIWAYEAGEIDDFPTTYSVTIDDNPVTGHTSASWQDNVDIVVNVDGLALGSHNVKIRVNDNGVDDGLASAASDTAIVTVVSEIVTSTTPTSQPAGTSGTTEPATGSTETSSGASSSTKTTTESTSPTPHTSSGDTVNFGSLFSLLALLSIPVIMKKRK
ncbi:MAG: hypothetical protein ACXAB7_12125 [Candidatus Kariarchaeaceae archaeon]|jgi:hypothetical protein